MERERKNKLTIHFSRIIVHLIIGSSFFASAAQAAPAFKVEQGHELPKTQIKTPSLSATSHEPVLLAADVVEYDQQNDVVTATGNVEVAQGDIILLADTLIYDHGRDQVQAMGHVSMMEPSGNIAFADAVELQDDLKAGVIHQFKARLIDNSVLVATQAKKIDENMSELFRMAYTPCNCTTKGGKPKNPMWSIKADHATIDQQEQEMVYDDATFNIYGFPMLYTPYFSHPTPGADNESGLLTPSFMQSQNLGTVFKLPVYYSIAADKDITLTPIITTQAGPVVAGEYRQMFDAGPLDVSGSFTHAPDHDIVGNETDGHTNRGHIDAMGEFRISEDYDWGFNIRRSTDDTYERLYNFSTDPVLISKIYAEGFRVINDSDRSYASVHGLSFQGLTAQDNSNVIPVVAPLINVNWQSEPGAYDSRFSFDANSMVLFRSTGAKSRRLSGIAGWKLPYITNDGQVIEFNAQMRTDIYDVSNVPMPNGTRFSGITGREIPQASLTWRYPFITRYEDSSLTIEPIANATVSPGGGNPDKIPNEDSLLPEFTDTNLFSSERFAGLDRVETGPRLSYGMRGQAQLYTDKFIDWLLGQQYRVNNDPNFPISNDLSSHFSDYVGKVGIAYDPFSFAYRFRVDKDNLSSSRSEFDAGYNYYPLSMSASYLSLQNDPILANTEIITGATTLNLTRQWSWTVGGTRDLRLDQTLTTYTGLGFKNECVNVTTMVGKDYTSLLDIKPSLTFWFKVSLKNLD